LRGPPGRYGRCLVALTRVFITGASSGLGAALARQYAAQGAIVGLSLAAAPSRRAGRDISAGRAAVYVGDVRDADALARALPISSRFGALRSSSPMAGISRGALTDRPEDLPTFRAVFDTNVAGLVHVLRPSSRR
jgi:NAD(P)-dependent dehydrogenase (short-subunit alcohol dehydrogenase family)